MLKRPSNYRRFMEKVFHEPSCGCWIWGACLSSGYGSFFIDGRNRPAHIVSYRHFKGEIPEGLEIDHRCKLRCCVNPDHLRAVTRAVNLEASRVGRTKKNKPRKPPASPHVKLAWKAAGSFTAIASALGLSVATVCNWKQVPVHHAIKLSEVTGVPLWDLRPDVWPKSDYLMT